MYQLLNTEVKIVVLNGCSGDPCCPGDRYLNISTSGQLHCRLHSFQVQLDEPKKIFDLCVLRSGEVFRER